MKKNDTMVTNTNPSSYKQAALHTNNNSTSSSSSSNNNHHSHHNRNNHHNKQQSNNNTTNSTTLKSSSQQNTTIPQQQLKKELLTLENTQVGNHVELKLITNSPNHYQTIKGEVFALDPELQLLALFISEGKHASSTRKTFRVIKTNTILEVISNTFKSSNNQQLQLNNNQQLNNKFLETVPFEDVSLPLPPVDIELIKNREEDAYFERKKKLGSGVSTEAQFIFDNLSKILPCQWDGKDIIVLENIKIEYPYQIDNVKGEDENIRNRVKKVLRTTLEKLKKQ
ncbi:hypothetical protein ABK040_003668 [Willaertia magna]